MYRGVCGIPDLPGKPSFIHQEARLRRFLLKGVLPPAAMHIMNAATMNMLNKVPHLEQAARVSKGEGAAIRPVVASTNAPKTPYAYALQSPEGEAFVEGIKKIQKGVGVPSGCQRTAFTARANYEAGGAVGKEDCKNGFPATSRQHMADAWHRRFPAAGKMYNSAYGEDSIVLVTWYDEDGEMHIQVRSCEDGSRQGCTLGTGVFCAKANDIYEDMDEEFPELEFLAIIDDLIVNIKPQTSKAGWHRAYTMYAQFHLRYKEEWAKSGITVAKAELLIPPHAPWPKPGVMPEDIKVTRAGMTVLGADIGTPAFREAQGEKQVDITEWQLEQISEFRGEHNYISYAMSIQCINKRMHYYVRVNPPCGYWKAIQRHDALMRRHNALDIQLDGFETPDCSSERLDRAHALIEQPSRVSGASSGRTPLAVVAPAAFCAGVLDAAAFPEFYQRRKALAPFCEWAHAEVLRLMGDVAPSKWNKRLKERFPPSASDLVNGSFATNLLMKFKKTRVQGEVVKVVMKRRLGELDASNSIEACREGKGDLTKDDAIAYHVQRHRSWASDALNGTIQNADLLPHSKRFVPYMRFFLLLPQLTRGQGGRATWVEEAGAALDRCLRCGGKDGERAHLDIAANHICACKASKSAQRTMHDKAVSCIYDWIRRFLPELVSKLEPSCTYLMGRHYSEWECSLLFHGDSTAATRLQAKELRALIDDRNEAGGEDRKALESTTRKAMRDMQAVLQARRGTDGGRDNRNNKRGVRPDIALWTSGPNGREIWVDFTGSHDTSASEQVTNSTLNVLAAAEDQMTLPTPGSKPDAPGKRPVFKPTPAITTKAKAKATKYAPLVEAGVAQYERGNRETSPILLPFVLTSRGTIGEDGMQFINIIKEEYAASLGAAGAPRDGMDPKRKMREFMAYVKNTLMLTHLNGLGELLSKGGEISWN